MKLIVGLVFIGVLVFLWGLIKWSRKRPQYFFFNRPATKVMKKIVTSILAASKVLKTLSFPVGLIIFISLMVLTWYWPDKLFPTNIPINIETQKAFIQLLGGIAIFITAYISWRRLTIADRQVLAMEDGQITERYTKAIEQLGSGNAIINIGGIFALERIAKDSVKRGDRRDYHTVMEVLTGFIREKSPIEKIVICVAQDGEESKACLLPEPITQDIEAAIAVIGRRELKYGEGEEQGFNLSRCNLKGANFSGVNIYGGNFAESNLVGAEFILAHCQLGSFRSANLQNAHLSGAELQDASFIGARLQRANLYDAKLQGAKFIRANLKNANLQKAQLQGAFLYGAILRGTIFEDADLREADFRNAYFNEETTISFEQLLTAKTLRDAMGLPEEMENRLREAKPELFAHRKISLRKEQGDT